MTDEAKKKIREVKIERVKLETSYSKRPTPLIRLKPPTNEQI